MRRRASFNRDPDLGLAAEGMLSRTATRRDARIARCAAVAFIVQLVLLVTAPGFQSAGHLHYEILGFPVPPVAMLILFLSTCGCGLLCALWLVRWLVTRLFHPAIAPGLCPTCRYNLTGNVSGICPECGTAIGPRPIEPGTEPVAGASLTEFLKSLPSGTRSREGIDQQLREERDAWGE